MRKIVGTEISRREALALLATGVGLALNGASASGADVSKAAAAVPRVPGVMQHVVDAMGPRFTTAGLERLTMTADQGKGPATLIYQNPRNFRYQENGKVITYDGTSTKVAGNADSTDDAFLESMFEDYFDGMVFNLQNASFTRLLMTRGRLDDGTSKSYAGPWLDVYQIRLPAPSVTGNPTRVKHFYFDSQTLLPDRVRYHAGANGKTRVETSFQNWAQVNGSYAPGSVIRKENETVVFTVKCSAWQIGPASNASDFAG